MSDEHPHIYKHEAFPSVMMAELKKYPKKQIYTKQQNQNQTGISWKKKFYLTFFKKFYFKNALFLQLSVRSEQKKINKLLLVKHQTW